MSKQKGKKKLPRNSAALAAKMRNSGGRMKHKLEPQKGAKNKQVELLEDEEDKPENRPCPRGLSDFLLNDLCICDESPDGKMRGCPVCDPQEEDEEEFDL